MLEPATEINSAVSPDDSRHTPDYEAEFKELVESREFPYSAKQVAWSIKEKCGVQAAGIALTLRQWAQSGMAPCTIWKDPLQSRRSILRILLRGLADAGRAWREAEKRAQVFYPHASDPLSKWLLFLDLVDSEGQGGLHPPRMHLGDVADSVRRSESDLRQDLIRHFVKPRSQERAQPGAKAMIERNAALSLLRELFVSVFGEKRYQWKPHLKMFLEGGKAPRIPVRKAFELLHPLDQEKLRARSARIINSKRGPFESFRDLIWVIVCGGSKEDQDDPDEDPGQVQLQKEIAMDGEEGGRGLRERRQRRAEKALESLDKLRKHQRVEVLNIAVAEILAGEPRGRKGRTFPSFRQIVQACRRLEAKPTTEYTNVKTMFAVSVDYNWGDRRFAGKVYPFPHHQVT